MPRLIFIVMTALFVLLQYRLWLSDSGMREVWRLAGAVAAQHAENAELAERNRALEADVRDLKAGLEAIEERARSDLGMIGPHESFYQVVLPENESSSRRAALGE
ncbi:cell division protein FtsB [soil metagenome]